jgi:nitroreductase
MPDALQLMRTRRSPRIPDLGTPGPSAAEIDTLLSVASRVPDHGKLVPWRFLVIEGEAKKRIAAKWLPLLRKAHPEATEDQIAKEPERLAQCPLVVAVISRAAIGYGANWVTGWAAYERSCLDLLGVGANERIAGFVHIGTPKAAQEERPRPPLSEIVTRI